MRWLAVWLLLTAVQALGWLASGLPPSPEGWAEGLVYLAVIPPVQTLALAVVATVRRRTAPPGAVPPP
jgi:hypothetical protein